MLTSEAKSKKERKTKGLNKKGIQVKQNKRKKLRIEVTLQFFYNKEREEDKARVKTLSPGSFQQDGQ